MFVLNEKFFYRLIDEVMCISLKIIIIYKFSLKMIINFKDKIKLFKLFKYGCYLNGC